MAILGKAALAVWLEPVPEAEDDFDGWYREEHLAERVGLPGFLRGRRGQALRGSPRYFAFYEVEGVEVFGSAAYTERQANPTARTRRIMPGVRSFARGVYRLVRSAASTSGPGAGRALLTLRLGQPAGGEEVLRSSDRDTALAALAAVPGVLSATLFELDPEATGDMTTERSLIKTRTAAPPFFFLCEGEDVAVAHNPDLRALLGPGGLLSRVAPGGVDEGVYELLHALCHGEA